MGSGSCFVHTRRLRLLLRQSHCPINIDAQNGFRPILCIFVCVTIDAMLNFDGDVDTDANADVQCEQTFTFDFKTGEIFFSKSELSLKLRIALHTKQTNKKTLMGNKILWVFWSLLAMQKEFALGIRRCSM